MSTRKPTRNVRISIALAAVLTSLACSHASAADLECFPLCSDHAPAAETQAVVDSSEPCGNSLVDKAESLNNKLKPVKEITGYIRSPQGLAMKLVNDHVVKIPAWVGYAVDPVGSLKNRAMGEVRTRVKEQLLPSRSCPAQAQEEAADNWERFAV
ncbi:MAG: hypothetical protein JNM76_16395 [Betaproteobacteria bacterium]|nr:hypothetical protein [Betaproteobacteria bacterium]